MVIAAAQVQDPVRWETGLRKHGDVFGSYTLRRPIHFATMISPAQDKLFLRAARRCKFFSAGPAPFLHTLSKGKTFDHHVR